MVSHPALNVYYFTPSNFDYCCVCVLPDLLQQPEETDASQKPLEPVPVVEPPPEPEKAE